MLPNLFENKYIQAAAMMAMQQNFQQCMPMFQMQQMFFANFMIQREKMLAFEQQFKNQRKSEKVEDDEESGDNTEASNGKKLDFLNKKHPLTKSDIKPMVHYLLNNIGVAEKSEMAEVKAHFSRDPLFVSLFEILLDRYNTTIKTKEEMIKYTLRKTLRWMRSRVTKGKESDPKEGMKVLIKKYFGNIIKERYGPQGLEDEKIIEKFLPFKKESRIKTMNTSFVTELFGSREFVKDYREFLSTFQQIMTVDNNRKVEKFIHFLEGCYTNQSFAKLIKFKRIPWLTSWITNTMNQARELPNVAGFNREVEITKTEVTENDGIEPKIEKIVKIESEQSSQMKEEDSSQ